MTAASRQSPIVNPQSSIPSPQSPIVNRQSSIVNPPSSLLLLGPTGSGKTPLGELLEQEGLWGRRCLHFDFGANLRRAAAGDAAFASLVPEDMAVIRRSLETGALLEDGEFHIALAIFRVFVAVKRALPTDIVVLNGLPRHAGQALRMAEAATVRMVVLLRCTATVALDRIRLNSGGDRAGRVDDERAAVERRIATFEKRTMPLVRHYSELGARVLEIPVSSSTTAAEMRAQIETHLHPI